MIQPVAEAAALVRAAGGWLHVDAIQAAGKIPVDIDALGADTLTLSAHKLGGPQGVGALVAAARARACPRRLHGGGQERGLRAGTENVPGIAGFGAAADARRRDLPPARRTPPGATPPPSALKAAGAHGRRRGRAAPAQHPVHRRARLGRRRCR